jgi:hypothetical protein
VGLLVREKWPRENIVGVVAKVAWLSKVDSDKLVRFLERTVVVHERHIPVIRELHLDFFCGESSVSASVCLREEDAVRVLITSGDLHAKDDAGEIVGFGASASKLDLRRKRHRSNETELSHRWRERACQTQKTVS